MAPRPSVLAFTSTKLPTWTSSASVVPGRSRAYGPMRQLRADRRRSTRYENGSIGVPAAIVHVAQYAIRSDRHVVAEHDVAFEHAADVDAHVAARSARVPRISMRAGSAIATPFISSAATRRACSDALDRGELRAVVDAAHVAFVAREVCDHGECHRRRRSPRCRSGNTHPARCPAFSAATQRLSSAVGAAITPVLISSIARCASLAVALLDDRAARAGGVAHDAAEAGRIGRPGPSARPDGRLRPRGRARAARRPAPAACRRSSPA